MNLAVDVGNTYAKIGLFVPGQPGAPPVRTESLEAVAAWRYVAEASGGVVVGSVGAPLPPLPAATLILSAATPLPFQSRYRTPETLGADRVAAVAGAQALFPGESCLVIDVGTCVTYDLIGADGQYYGGHIGPGWQMRFRALRNDTARLPLVEQPDISDFLGEDTPGAIGRGVTFGMVAELNGMIDAYGHSADRWPAPDRVVLCGGDARFFESKIDVPIFVVGHLVLSGLNAILEYNAENLDRR